MDQERQNDGVVSVVGSSEGMAESVTRTSTGVTVDLHRSRGGFAAMDPQMQRQIASQGGKAAHAKGKAHKYDSAEARIAGRKGGLEVGRRKREQRAREAGKVL